jgi:hypothetical protein
MKKKNTPLKERQNEMRSKYGARELNAEESAPIIDHQPPPLKKPENISKKSSLQVGIAPFLRSILASSL